MSTLRELKRRIGSVNSLQKMTGAMKMIASSRKRKVQNALDSASPYLYELRQTLGRVSQEVSSYESPLGQERPVRRMAVIAFGSDDGLCGSFNVLLYKKFREVLNDYQAQVEEPVHVYPIGRKIQREVVKNTGIEVKPVPEAFARKDYVNGMLTLADDLMRQFLAGEIDRVEVVYAHFKSMGTQIMTRMQLLPWAGTTETHPVQAQSNFVYIYEPDQQAILDTLYPLVLRATLYNTLLDNQLSEQAARIMSMQIANDNASKLLKTLKLEYNKLRQQLITAELLDIIGGSVAR
ncbi:MAG: ATP synthase F1 subunit gamma [Tannerella sp.]|nr:ATP synthase F1 subunit gamma [Tannerella sp.]